VRAGRVPGAVLAAGALVLGGCGGGGDHKRAQVDAFLRQANSVQEQAAPDFNRANRAYLSFSKGQLPPAQAKKELAAAEQSMRATRDRLAALDAPADARRLQSGLVALFDADAVFAHESTLLATFAPASAKAQKPLPGIGRRLTRGLSGAKTPQAQEAVLKRYAADVRGVIATLQPLQPPPLLVERHHGQVQHLQRVRSLALQLARALQRQDSRLVAKLLLRFKALSTGPGSPSALSPQALRAYNRRYLKVRTMAQDVEREQRRLQDTLK
jgi:hypothetical protein